MHERFNRMNNVQLGSWFEGKITDALKAIKKDTNKRLYLHRFYDTKSAGSYLPEQPADFQVAASAGVWLVEAKASFKKPSLTSCLGNALKGHQATSMLLWGRVNKPSLILFFCAETEQVELWDGASTARVRITPNARLRKEDVLETIPIKGLKQTLFNHFIGENYEGS